MLKWDLVPLAPVYWTVKVLLSSLGLSLLYVIQHESLACILLYFCFIDTHSRSLIFFFFWKPLYKELPLLKNKIIRNIVTFCLFVFS